MLPKASVLFVSQAGVTSGAIDSYNLKKRIEVVKKCRTVKKHDMKFNSDMPKMEVDPELFVSQASDFRQNLYATSHLTQGTNTQSLQTVVANGKECKAEAATSLPLTHQYFVY